MVTLVAVTLVILSGIDVSARAALALALAVSPPDEEKCPLGVPLCNCGCRSGESCRCASKRKVISPPCSGQCVCGCNSGRQCDCNQTTVSPTYYYHAPAQSIVTPPYRYRIIRQAVPAASC